MNKSIYISLALLTASVTFSGCSSSENTEAKIVEAYSCSIDIEGMMCEKGCKSAIQSKLKGKEGVLKATVDYEAAKAFVTYDLNRVSTEDLIATIENIADGSLYKAVLIEDQKVDLELDENQGESPSNSSSVQEFSFEIPDVTGIIPSLF